MLCLFYSQLEVGFFANLLDFWPHCNILWGEQKDRVSRDTSVTQQRHRTPLLMTAWGCLKIEQWLFHYNTGHVLCHWLVQTSVEQRRSLVRRTPLSGAGEKVVASGAQAAEASPVPWWQPWVTRWRNCRRRWATASVPNDRKKANTTLIFKKGKK